MVVLPPEPPDEGYWLSPIFRSICIQRKPQRVTGDDQDRRARSHAEILRAHLDLN